MKEHLMAARILKPFRETAMTSMQAWHNTNSWSVPYSKICSDSSVHS